MKPPLNMTITKVATSLNSYGEYAHTGSAESLLVCHFREITQLVENANQETVQSDAMGWFNPDASISIGAIFRFSDEEYRVIRLVRARRLSNTAVQFIKVYFEKTKEVVS